MMWTLPFLDVVFCEQTRAGAEEGARIDPLLYCIDDSIDQFVITELHDVVIAIQLEAGESEQRNPSRRHGHLL